MVDFKEIFTSNKKASASILDYLEDKNLTFILGREEFNNELLPHVKMHKNIIPTNVIIDSEPDREVIERGLNKLIEIANRDGYALGYAHGFTLTIEIIRNWLPYLDKQGIKLVPVFELLKEQNGAGKNK